MKSYRDLNIYKEARGLAVRVHHMSLQLPKHELYEEGSQIRRSSKAISVCIVEGYGRKRYKADFIKFLVYGQSECDETVEHLEYLFETGSLTNEQLYQELKPAYTSLSKQLNRFIAWVDTNWNNFDNKP